MRIGRNTEVVALTPKAHKEAEEHGIEETKADCKNVLVDHCRHCKHKQHGYWSETPLRHLEDNSGENRQVKTTALI